MRVKGYSMDLPTIKIEQLNAEPAESPAPVLSEAELRMRQQRGFRFRLVPLQHNHRDPIRIHHGPRLTGKKIRAARKAAKEAAKKVGSDQCAVCSECEASPPQPATKPVYE